MGRVGSTGTNGGNSSSPQTSLDQKNYENLVNKISKQDLINGLKNDGIKFSEKDIVFIKKDESGKTIWLETGNDNAGLKHIVNQHAGDFKKAMNVNEKQIPSVISKAISKENFVNKTERVGANGQTEIRKLYKYDGKYYLAISFGDNGFIVTSHPKKV